MNILAGYLPSVSSCCPVAPCLRVERFSQNFGKPNAKRTGSDPIDPIVEIPTPMMMVRSIVDRSGEETTIPTLQLR